MKREQASDSSVGFTGNQFVVVWSHKGRLQRDPSKQHIIERVFVQTLSDAAHCAVLLNMNDAFRYLRLLCCLIVGNKIHNMNEIHQSKKRLETCTNHTKHYSCCCCKDLTCNVCAFFIRHCCPPAKYQDVGEFYQN